LRHLARRRNVEAREIATQILAWRWNVGIRQAKRLRNLSLDGGFEHYYHI
jgi:hypothetical protein